MVQVGAAFSYDHPIERPVEDNPVEVHAVEENDRPAQQWTALVREAVRDFVTSIGDASKQLASAGERFATESLRLLDEAAETAQRSANQSSDMAAAARQAADDSRRAAEAVLQTVAEAGESVREEARLAVQDATSRIEASIQAGERIRSELQQRIEEAYSRLELSAGASSEAVRAAQQAADQARQAADAIARSVSVSQETLTATQQAVTEARQAANDAAQNASRSETSIGSGAQHVLERLESDYALLTRLVQELHTRISNLTAGAAQPSHFTPAPSLEPVPAAEHHDEPPPSDLPHEAPISIESYRSEPPLTTMPAPPQRPAPQPWPDAYPVEPPLPAEPHDHPAAPVAMSHTEPPAPEPSHYEPPPVAPPPPPAVESPTVSGRVLVSISPVPDFDRLLSLDGALGRMPDVRNVSLADYAKEEVTFRIEVDRPMSAEEFGRNLSESAGMRTEIASAVQGNLALRILA